MEIKNENNEFSKDAIIDTKHWIDAKHWYGGAIKAEYWYECIDISKFNLLKKTGFWKWKKYIYNVEWSVNKEYIFFDKENEKIFEEINTTVITLDKEFNYPIETTEWKENAVARFKKHDKLIDFKDRFIVEKINDRKKQPINLVVFTKDIRNFKLDGSFSYHYNDNFLNRFKSIKELFEKTGSSNIENVISEDIKTKINEWFGKMDYVIAFGKKIDLKDYLLKQTDEKFKKFELDNVDFQFEDFKLDIEMQDYFNKQMIENNIRISEIEVNEKASMSGLKIETEKIKLTKLKEKQKNKNLINKAKTLIEVAEITKNLKLSKDFLQFEAINSMIGKNTNLSDIEKLEKMFAKPNKDIDQYKEKIKESLLPKNFLNEK